MGQITAWSMSRLATYELCPRKAYYEYVEKRPTGPKHPALERGVAIHKMAAQYIKGQVQSLAPALQSVSKMIGSFRKAYTERLCRVEYDIALDRNWNPCQWMDAGVYVRMKLDVLRLTPDKSTAVVVDWKTGKFKEVDSALGRSYDDALNLYSVAVLSLGFARQASSQLVFTDSGKVVNREKGTVSLRVLTQEQKKWDRRASPMLNDDIWAPHPGMYCDWCPYTANKGGPCVY